MENGWTKKIKELTESRDQWKLEWGLLMSDLNAANDRNTELEAALKRETNEYIEASHTLIIERDEAREQVKKLEAERDAAQGEVERLKMELEATRKELGDKTWRLRRPYEAWLSDSLKKDNCRNCKHSRPPTIAHNPDRVSCQYADGWPHWTNKCDRWEAQEAIGTMIDGTMPTPPTL